MRSRWKYTAVTVIAFGWIVLSIFAPYQFQMYRDSQILGKPHLQDHPVDETEEELPVLTILDKLKLLSSEKITGVSTGNQYSGERILTQCSSELQELFHRGVLTADPSGAQWEQRTGSAALVMSSYDDSRAMILWTVVLSSDNGYLKCGIDDETGRILYLYTADYNGDKETLTSDKVLAFAGYLGVESGENTGMAALAATFMEILEPRDSILKDYPYVFQQGESAVLYYAAETEYGFYLGHDVTEMVYP